MADKSALGGAGSTHSERGSANYNQPASRIFGQPEVTNAQDVIVMFRGPDGKIQAWASGDQQKATKLFRDGAQLLGVRDLQTT